MFVLHSVLGVFFLFVALAPGIFTRKDVLYKTDASDREPISKDSLNKKLKALGIKRAILWILALPIFVGVASYYNLSQMVILTSPILIVLIFDRLITSKFFCCSFCNKSLWSYTTQRLKVRKLKLRTDLTRCPFCGTKIE